MSFPAFGVLHAVVGRALPPALGEFLSKPLSTDALAQGLEDLSGERQAKCHFPDP